jgi:enamine deaminase RidA (YjgF/YER057c/UK114 family)
VDPHDVGGRLGALFTVVGMGDQHIRSGSSYEPTYGFSRAVRVGDRVIVAGTAPIPPEGEEVASTAYEQMLRCGEIMLGALGQAGAAAGDVARTRMFIVDPADADEVGRAHQQVFGAAIPCSHDGRGGRSARPGLAGGGRSRSDDPLLGIRRGM